MAQVVIYVNENLAVVHVVREPETPLLGAATDALAIHRYSDAIARRNPVVLLGQPIQRPLLERDINASPLLSDEQKEKYVAVVRSSDPSDVFDFRLAGSAIVSEINGVPVAAFGAVGENPPPLFTVYVDP